MAFPNHHIVIRIALALLWCAAATAAAANRDDSLQSLLSAEFALQGGDATSASRHYLEAARTSADPQVAERAARIALHAGDAAGARKALDRWRVLSPGSAALLQTEAMLALESGDAAAAQPALARLLALPGAEGWQRALQALAGQEGPETAGAVLSGLVEGDQLPAEPDAWFAFGGLARRLGLDDLAGQLAERAAVRFPRAPRVWLWQAQRERMAGDAEAARAAIHKAIELAPDDTGVRLTAAAELDALGDSAAAAGVLAEGPQDPDTLLGRVAYLARGEDTPAMEALYAELALPGADAAAGDDDRLFLLGQLAELLERPEEALAWYARVGGPERRSQAALREAVALEALDRVDEALARLRELQASDSSDGQSIRDAYLLEAELLLKRDRSEEAVAAYGRGLGIFEDDPQLLYARALSLAELDRVAEAERDLKRLIALEPGNADALNALGYTLADSNQRLAEARGYIEQALALAPDTPAIVDSLGWVLYRLGETEQAKVQLRRAFELQPDPEIAAHLGEVLWTGGDQQGARAVWKQGLELEPDNAVLRSTMQRLDP